MGKLFKIAVVAGAAAAGCAAIFALKKRKELEDYDYEELDDDFDDCVEDCVADAEDAAEEVKEGVEETLDKVEDAVEETDE
ncbi:MAG: hypothetical protein IJR91_07350 [Ruminococcus sp.]|nr:hypothetical protein [Ruminococcus sp.]